MENWPWKHPTYSVKIGQPLEKIQYVEIDPSVRMMDVNRENNIVVIQKD